MTSKRTATQGALPVLNIAGDRLLMRSAPTQRESSQPWFRIENKTETSADVYIYDEIGGWWGTNAADFVQEITALDVQTINLHLNSPGGEVFDGVAIYNALKNHKASVIVYVDGIAASAASFIAQSGDRVVMGEASTMMIHDGMAICIGNEKDMLDTASVLDKLSNSIAGIYALRAGGTTEEWRALMREEVWYTAEEAVEAKLADEVQASSSTDDEAASNKWDLSIFNHAGRAHAPSPLEVRQRIVNQLKESIVVGDKNTVINSAGESGEGGTAAPVAPNPTTQNPESPNPSSPDTKDKSEANADPKNVAGQFTFTVNGTQTSDPRQVQAHINALETFRSETRDQGRRDFVAKLASDNKITGPQVAGFEKLAMSLTDEQYEMWRAPWDVAPVLPLLAQHGAGSTSASSAAASDENKDRIEVLEGIVANHRNGGMNEETLKNQASYKELQRLKSNSNQS